MKKLNNFKWFTLGVAVCLILSMMVFPAMAASFSKTAELVYNNIKITLDGTTITPKDASGNAVEPFVIDGTTYLPVRAISNALGLYVGWDSATNTVKLTTKEQTGQEGDNQTEIKWHESGMYKVGKDIPAGEYCVEAAYNNGAYYCISSDSSGDSILANNNFRTFNFVTIRDGEYFEVTRGRFFDADKWMLTVDSNNLGEGMYRVGVEIPAGEYKLTSENNNGAYLCVYDSSASNKNIITNDNFTGSKYITVSDGTYLELDRCSAALVK